MGINVCRVCRAINTSVFVLTVLTNNITYTILNSIVLILCIDCLDMRMKKPLYPLMYTLQIR